MFNVKVEIKNFNYLEKIIDDVKSMRKMQGISSEFKQFIKNKVKNTLEQVMIILYGESKI